METRKKVPGARSLLLLEFASSERWVYNSRYYPFLKGAAEKLGITVKWLCFGAETSMVKTGRGQVRRYRDLPPQDLAVLRWQAAALRPTPILLRHPVSKAVQDCLARAAGGRPRWRAMSDLPAAHEGPQVDTLPGLAKKTEQAGEPDAVAARTDWLLDWLGEKSSADRGRFLVDAFRPSYDVVVGNEAFRKNVPHILIMGGVICDHTRKLKDNEFYRELDSSACSHDFGCGFCTHYRGPTSDPRQDPVAVAAEQFRRLRRTSGRDGRDCGAFDVCDIRLFRCLDRFFAMVFKVGLGPSTFFFEPRIDRFLQGAGALEKALPGLRRRGHKVAILRMGAETLVQEENDFYNKGITLAQIDAATRRLRALAEKFPENFQYDPSYGHITCSPWTTLETFATGVERAIARGFDPKGVWLYTPLILYRSAPLTQLARRQGAVIAGAVPDLALLYEPSVNECPFDTILPWRFKDERMAAAFALIVRFCAAALRGRYSDALFRGDRLYARMLRWAQRPAFYGRPDLFAREVIAAVKSARPPFRKSALLQTAWESYAALDRDELEFRARLSRPTAGKETYYGDSQEA